MGALPEGQRFSKDRQPADEARGRRTSYLWLRELLSEAAHDNGPNGETHREAVGRHLIEVASSWEVVVRGHGDEAMPVANGSASVAAAELLFKYDMGRAPLGAEESRLAVAEHYRHISLDQFSVLVRALGERLKTMTPEEFGRFAKACDGDVTRYLRAAGEELGRGDATMEVSEAPQIESPEPGPARPADVAPATLDEDDGE